MANNGRRRVNSRSDYNEQYVYEGNAVRKIEAIPQEKTKKRQVSRTTSRNRAKASRMGKGYVCFLAAVSAASVFMCVDYLQLKAAITAQNATIIGLESSLNDLRADNDAYYNEVITSVDVEYIRNKAMTELGMAYPTEDQVYVFDTAGNSYVRQYQNIPDNTK